MKVVGDFFFENTNLLTRKCDKLKSGGKHTVCVKLNIFGNTFSKSSYFSKIEAIAGLFDENDVQKHKFLFLKLS